MNPIDWSKPAAEILEDLLADVWCPTNAAITVAEIVDAVGKDAARLVIGTLQAGAAQDPLLASSSNAISTVGMSLSSIDRQEMIDQLAMFGNGPNRDQPWPDAVRDAVKALGGVWVGRWSLEGFDAEPTLSQVQSRQSAVIEAVALKGLQDRIVNAAALMGERIAVDSDPFDLFAQCWGDAV